jgi:hypothetical protein
MKTTKIWQIAMMAGLGLILILAGRVRGDFMFGTPKNLGPIVNSSASEYDSSISADGLELYFQSNRSGGYGDRDMYVTTRTTIQDEWSEPVNLGPVLNSSVRDAGPEISSDGLSLYFNSNRAGGFGNYDLYVTTRQSVFEPWGPPVNLGPNVNSSADEISASISADGLSLFFSDGDALGTIPRPGGYGESDIWVARRASLTDPWEIPVNVGPEINLSFAAGAPEISSTGLLLFFSGYRTNAGGTNDLWVAVRDAVDAPWSNPVNLGPSINSDLDADLNPSISADGRMLYFASFRSGGSGNSDLWQVPIEPVVDINGDGMVDSADMCLMIENWGQNNPLCDIGPTPLGDGIVDVQDLIVLSEHLFEEILPDDLVVYLKLDETEGDVAFDSTGQHDGMLNGGPQWQPAGGLVDGALECDGIDDYISTDFVLNPEDGSFSIFAWIKGGTPGQVIISQTDGTGIGQIWLGTEPGSGKLMTELVPPSVGRFIPQPLRSEFIITDGLWHHVGLSWDGQYRSLYVDGIEVAKDDRALNLAPLKSSDGGLYIGAGNTLDATTFFSGMVDELRIYNRPRNTMEIEAMIY